MEALRQIATTSLFLQNEQNVVTNRTVPTIKEPDKRKGKRHLLEFFISMDEHEHKFENKKKTTNDTLKLNLKKERISVPKTFPIYKAMNIEKKIKEIRCH